MISTAYGRQLQRDEPLGKSEILYVPSMDIHDPSKLQNFMESPRSYFFTHVAGWQGTEPNINLVAGTGLHRALEILSLSLNDPSIAYSPKIVNLAYELYMDVYRASFPNELNDAQFSPKDPANILRFLIDYTNKWHGQDVGKLRTLYTELAFSVPVSEDRIIHGKMDTVMLEDETHIFSLEHKSTSRKTQSWMDQWDIILQPMIYHHALDILYEDEADDFQRVKGVTINGLILRKGENEPLRIPVAKREAQIHAGLAATNHWLDQIEWNYRALLDTSPNDEYMEAFPCNGSSCAHKPWGCPFSAFCAHWPNPLQHLERVPVGLHKEYWDPRREQDDARNVVHLETSREVTAL